MERKIWKEMIKQDSGGIVAAARLLSGKVSPLIISHFLNRRWELQKKTIY